MNRTVQVSCQVVIFHIFPQSLCLSQTYVRFLPVEVTLLCNFLHTVAILGLACPHGDKLKMFSQFFQTTLQASQIMMAPFEVSYY